MSLTESKNKTRKTRYYKKKLRSVRLGLDKFDPISKAKLSSESVKEYTTPITYGFFSPEINLLVDSYINTHDDYIYEFDSTCYFDSNKKVLKTYKTTQEIAVSLEEKSAKNSKRRSLCSVFNITPSKTLTSAISLAIKARRREYESKRAKLLLLMLESGMDYKCQFCDTTQNITIDHKHPLSRGGSDKPGNLQFLCRRCNSIKGSKFNSI